MDIDIDIDIDIYIYIYIYTPHLLIRCDHLNIYRVRN